MSTISWDARFRAAFYTDCISYSLHYAANNDMLIPLTEKDLVLIKANLLTKTDQGQCTEKQHLEVEPSKEIESLGSFAAKFLVSATEHAGSVVPILVLGTRSL